MDAHAFNPRPVSKEDDHGGVFVDTKSKRRFGLSHCDQQTTEPTACQKVLIDDSKRQVSQAFLQLGALFTDAKTHGVFTMGKSATEATTIAMYLEEAAMTTHLAMLRGPVEELPQEEIDRCYTWFRQNYGQTGQKPINS